MKRSDLRFKEKRLVVLSNYRTGSSFLTELVADLNQTVKVGEYFAPSESEERIIPVEKGLTQLLAKPRYCYKLMPNQITNDFSNEGYSQLKRVLDLSADRVLYLYRRDFRATALSLIAADWTKTYHLTGFNFIHNPDKVKLPVDITDMPDWFIESRIDILKFNYNMLGRYYRERGGIIYCMEDDFTDSLYVPYQRDVVWVKGEPDIDKYVDGYDVEKVIFG